MTPTLKLPAAINNVRKYIDELSLRERGMLFGTVVALLSTVWYLAMMQPLSERADSARESIAAVRARIENTNSTLENQVMAFSASGSEQQRQFDRVQNRLDDIDRSLGNYAAELIGPAEMARVLEGLLKERSKLKLIRVRNLDAEPLLGPEEALTSTLFKHGLEIEFEGSYMACLEYLEDIEALPWRFYWQVLEIDVEDYPHNRIRLEVSTLSFDEEWIGA